MNTYRRLFIFLSFFFLTGWPLSQAQAQKDLPKVIRSLTVKTQPYATPAVLPRKAPAVSISPQLGKLRLPASWAPKTDKTKRPAAGTLSLAELQSLSAELQPPAPIHFPNPQALELLLQTGAPLRALKQFGSLCGQPTPYQTYRLSFPYLAEIYYLQSFPTPSSSLRSFLKRIGGFHNDQLEKSVIKRIIF